MTFTLLLRRLTVALALLMLFPLEAAAGPALPPGVVAVTTVEGISEYRLDNGLTVLFAPDDSKPTTTVNITYRVGSRHEGYGETGMAHLLEHLVFKGTPKLPDGALVAEMKRRGMQYNGSTWFDRTNYYQTFAASDDNLDWALAMEADRMVNSFIARKDLDTEMTVVRNEMEAGENEPFRILWEKMAAAAYQWHNYGNSTIGARADVENVRIENLQAFYRKYYQPDNAVLVVTGKFDPAAALARVVAHFGPIPKPARTLAPTWTRDPVQDGEREVTLARVGDTQFVATMYHTVPAAHPDAAALQVLAFVLGDTPTGRLHKALIQTRKAAAADVFAFGLAEPGYLMSVVQLAPGQSRAEARKILLAETEGLLKKPVTEAEVQRARVALGNAFDKTLADPTHFGVALSEAIAQGDWRLFFLNRDRIERVSAADVNRVARSYLKPANRTLGQFVPTDKPDRATPPPAPPLEEVLAGYTGRAALEAGEAFDPTPETIAQRTRLDRLPVGLQLAFLPKKTRGATVNGLLIIRGGDEKSLFGQGEVAQMAAALLTRGAGGKSRQQIADALDALKATLSVSTGDGNAVTVRFETRREHLPAFLDLLRTVLRQPDFPAAELEQLRTESLAAVEEGRREPQAVAMRALARLDNPYPRGDVRYSSTLDEELADIRAVRREQLVAFHKRFMGLSHAQWALVGDFDAEAVRAHIARTFGDWKSASPYARLPLPYRATRGEQITLPTPDKANAFYLGGIALPLRDDAPEWPALVLANRIVGGGDLKNRLADRLRQKDGLTYGVGTALRGNAYEANASLLFYAIFAPQNRERIAAGLREEIARVLDAGVSDAELAEAKSAIAQEVRIARTRDASLAGLLAGHLNLGRDMAWEAAFDARLQALTRDEVNGALRKYLDAARIAGAWAGDFAAAAQP